MTPRLERALGALSLLAGGLALLRVGLDLGRTLPARLSYPYDLEWMEGGMLVHAWRLRAGLPLYAEPSADWIPYIYPPLYPALLALLGTVLPLDYALGRGISLLGTGAAGLALVLLLRRAGAGMGLALGGLAAFLSTFEDSGAFFDLVRADGLLLGLLAGCLYLALRGWAVAAGLLLVLAWLTKHSVALLGLPLLLGLARAHGRRAARNLLLASVPPALLLTALLQVESEGWFLLYLLEVPAHHGLVGRRLGEAPLELARDLPLPLLGLGLAALLARGAPRSPSLRTPAWILGPSLLLLIGLAVLMRAHVGGYLNVLMPGHFALVAALAIAAAALPAGRRSAGNALLALLCLIQVELGRFEPERLRPTEADRRAGDALIARIAAIEGEVFVPHAPWYPLRAGKRPSFPLIALWDLDHGGELARYTDVLPQAFAERRWAAVIVADTKFGYDLETHYRRAERIRYEGGALLPRTGWQVRPRELYLPRP